MLQPQYLPRSPQLAFLTMSVVVEGCQQGGGGGGDQAAQAPEQAQLGLAGGGGGGDAVQQAQQARQARQQGQQQGQQAQRARRGQRLTFLYRLVPGHAAPSFGVHCAELAGVPEAALERARELIALQVSGWGERWGRAATDAPSLIASRSAAAVALTTQALPLPPLLQASGAPVHAVAGGLHAQRAAAYRALVQRLLALDVHDAEAVQGLAAAALETTGGDDGGDGGRGGSLLAAAE